MQVKSHRRYFGKGLPCWAAPFAFLAALAPLSFASAQPVDAAGDDIDACVVAERFEWGFAAISRNPYHPNAFVIEADFLEEIIAEDGSRSSAQFLATIPDDFTATEIDERIDSLVVTLRVGNAQLITGPTLVYYTRDNTIPFDVAPAKLVYPRYVRDDEQLEMSVTMGDLERHMDFGPGNDPVQILSWIAKKVGTSYEDDDLVQSGDVPLAPIWQAREDIRQLLTEWAERSEEMGC